MFKQSRPASAVQPKGKEPKAKLMAKEPKAKSKPRARMGADGLPEAVVTYMNHAAVSPVFIYAKNLFRPLQSGTRAQGVNATGHYTRISSKIECRWTGESALDITDQLVFFYLCQQAAIVKKAFLIGTQHSQRKLLVETLKIDRFLASQDVLVGVKVTGAEIAKGIGLSATGTNSKAMLASLQRLANTTMHRDATGPQGQVMSAQSTLIGCLERPECVVVILNPEASMAAEELTNVAWVNMTEQQSLKSKSAMRLNAWLSAWASSWSVKTVTVDKLMVNIWGDKPATASVKKDRTRTLKLAVAEVAALPGWVCQFDTHAKVVKVRKPIFVGEAGAPTALTPTAAAGAPTKAAASPTVCAVSPTA